MDTEIDTTDAEKISEHKNEPPRAASRILPDKKTIPIPLPRKRFHKSELRNLELDLDQVQSYNDKVQSSTTEENIASELQLNIGFSKKDLEVKKDQQKNSIDGLLKDDRATEKTVETGEDKNVVTQKSAGENTDDNRVGTIGVNGQKFEESCEEVLGIWLSKCNWLKMNKMIQDVRIIVHIMDAKEKHYLSKSERWRNVSYNMENSDYILPVMTNPCTFRKYQWNFATWNELLVFNESFSYITQPDVIVFFQIINLVNDTTTLQNIAVAFLRILSSDGKSLNTGKSIILQLFNPPTSIMCSEPQSNISQMMKWYEDKKWIKYPGTLQVKICGIQESTLDKTPKQRSRTPLQPEVGSADSVKSLSFLENIDVPEMQTLIPLDNYDAINWNRIPGQRCHLPNCVMTTLSSGSQGFLAVRFSNCGRYVACGGFGYIFIYSVLNGDLLVRLAGHDGMIYMLRWSHDNATLLSASNDCTACLWSLRKSDTTYPSQILSHASYVYCSEFIWKSEGVVTGSFDRVLRIWKKNVSGNFELIQEILGHIGYISSICCITDDTLSTGDSKGRIIFWKCNALRWEKERDVNTSEMTGVVINQLEIHPGGKRMLIHARDSTVRIMDISTGAIIHRFHIGLNDHLQCNSSFSACGNMLFTASEDGSIDVFECNTAEQVAVYDDIIPNGCASVQFHPFDHIAIFSAYNMDNSYALLVKYSRECTSERIVTLLRPQTSSTSSSKELNDNNKIDDKLLSSFHMQY